MFGRKARGHIRKKYPRTCGQGLRVFIEPFRKPNSHCRKCQTNKNPKKEWGKNSQLPIYQVEPAWCILYVPRLKECGRVVCVSASVQFRAVTYLSCSHYSHINSQQLRHVQRFSSNNIIPKVTETATGIKTRNANVYHLLGAVNT